MPKLKLVEGFKSSDHPFYGTWSNMRDRCNNPNNKDYKFYGAKGIKVCFRWDLFENFVFDLNSLGMKPNGFTLDRIDSSKDYCIENCRWASKMKQARNQKIKHSNKSGVSGVNKTKDGGYMSRITNEGGRIYLGYFKTLEEAIEARIKAEEKLRWKNVI